MGVVHAYLLDRLCAPPEIRLGHLQDMLASWSTPFKYRYRSLQGSRYYELSFVESRVSRLLLLRLCNSRPM